MSMKSLKSSKFTFQSSVHSSHVLQCLNEQRKKDLLCDVTVVVENQSFRAHCAVLASCSVFFSARVSSHTTPQGLVINLPDEVTAEGFEPLLEFAYTSKLIFTKENVLEIRNCASVLGFKNLDKACFDFLLPKFFDSSRSASTVPRKQCCKTKCCRSRDTELSLINKEDVNDDGKSLLQPSQFQFKEKEPTCPSSAPIEDAPGSCHNVQSENNIDYSLLCPKYRKFQIACGKERSCLDVCGLETSPVSLEKTDDNCSLVCFPYSSNEYIKEISKCSKTSLNEDEDSLLSKYCAPSICGPCSPCMGQPLLQDCSKSTQSICVSEVSAKQDMPFCSEMNDAESTVRCKSDMENCFPDQSNTLRSKEEIEVARQLTFWPDFCPIQGSPSGLGLVGKPSNFNCLKSWHLDPNAEECPFLQDFGAVGAQLHDGEGGSMSQGSPYVPSNQSGEDSDSFDTEGDSESYSSERVCEIALPLSVQQIVSLSRNDFQQMLKQQCLTREQLEVVHDIRRRSKNRIAARRCRKRKLDCIYNLECEIEKLRSEREKLTGERMQLNQMKGKVWQSYSGLYERVCAEAALRPEQLQILAKYSSPDCPMSAFLCPTSDHSQSTELQQASGLPSHTCCSEEKPSISSSMEYTGDVAQSSLQNLFPTGFVDAPSHCCSTDTLLSEKSGCCSIVKLRTDLISKNETD
ncbi:transcription regulator protein BACH1-like [Xyrauchen texanus]|uniref:transcription regulator protein BACH1-like n=1 Tax=Xyrauchen texanus TaxID=154827 RepID=UPI002241FACB|nr:transcription regulator protein BACH1-like [Xyrauchen texanus]